MRPDDSLVRCRASFARKVRGAVSLAEMRNALGGGRRGLVACVVSGLRHVDGAAVVSDGRFRGSFTLPRLGRWRGVGTS